jgi:hypothetical protein
MSNGYLGRKKKSPICDLGVKGSSCKPRISPQEEQEAKRELFLEGGGEAGVLSTPNLGKNNP